MGTTTAKKAHYLQHVDFEGPGYISTWLLEQGYMLTVTRFYEPAYRLPAPADIDVLIVMGGPMGIYDASTYTWLNAEKIFIRACLTAGIKVLGICLGAQLIADCLNGKVWPAPHKEIGWFSVQPTLISASKKHGLSKMLTTLFATHPIVFHWHGDQFEIPKDCTSLLESTANANQAFVLNDQVVALQFHLEVTKESLAFMLEKGSAALNRACHLPALFPYVQSETVMMSNCQHIETCNRLLGSLLSQWLTQ